MASLSSEHSVPVLRRCECNGRRIPLRISKHVAQYLSMLPNEPVMSYRCPKCKAVLTLTAAECQLDVKYAVAGSLKP